jgi:hypothetical protein
MLGVPTPITPEQFHDACVVAAPCTCDAPIAFTYHCETPEGATYEGITLYRINLITAKLTTLYSDTSPGEERDDLGLRCTKCGVDWTCMNPLF